MNCPICNNNLSKHQVYISFNNTVINKMENCHLYICVNCDYRLLKDNSRNPIRFHSKYKNVKLLCHFLWMIGFLMSLFVTKIHNNKTSSAQQIQMHQT